MQIVHYEERDGRWWLADSAVEGLDSLLATALALCLVREDALG